MHTYHSNEPIQENLQPRRDSAANEEGRPGIVIHVISAEQLIEDSTLETYFDEIN